MQCDFTITHLKKTFQRALNLDYSIITCSRYVENCSSLPKILVLRFDVDYNVRKVVDIVSVLNELDIKGTFFFRLHSPTYNPFDFANYEYIRYIINTGHEVGLHQEVVDFSKITLENQLECFKRDVKIFNEMFKVKIKGTSSHFDYTGNSNRDFWKLHSAKELGLYDAFELSQDSFCVTDSAFTYWKTFDNSNLLDDNRCLCEHLKDNHKIIHAVLHPVSHYKKHYYED